MAAGGKASELELECQRLRTSLSHLERSQRELRAALDVAAPDPEYKVAIQDNCVTIAKYR